MHQVLGEAVLVSNVMMAGGTGTVAVQTCQCVIAHPAIPAPAGRVAACAVHVHVRVTRTAAALALLLAHLPPALLTMRASREAPGFKDVVAAIVDSPANPAVLFDANPGNWR